MSEQINNVVLLQEKVNSIQISMNKHPKLYSDLKRPVELPYSLKFILYGKARRGLVKVDNLLLFQNLYRDGFLYEMETVEFDGMVKNGEIRIISSSLFDLDDPELDLESLSLEELKIHGYCLSFHESFSRKEVEFLLEHLPDSHQLIKEKMLTYLKLSHKSSLIEDILSSEPFLMRLFTILNRLTVYVCTVRGMKKSAMKDYVRLFVKEKMLAKAKYIFI